ncbi:MAG: hypothetical protein GY920_17910 [Aliivibrio sp.]|nr:hypothetical protein [Aliivibrio sp.]MCP4255430.1 hypothetical protein [Candidatus Scalindua sp.]
MFDFVKKIFGFDGVANSALKIVDKLAGTDWAPKEQAQFILDHAQATKYQSPTRRAMAIMITVEWFLLANTWLIATIFGRIMNLESCILLASDVSTFLQSDINLLINGLMAFYFLIGVKK